MWIDGKWSSQSWESEREKDERMADILMQHHLIQQSYWLGWLGSFKISSRVSYTQLYSHHKARLAFRLERWLSSDGSGVLQTPSVLIIPWFLCVWLQKYMYMHLYLQRSSGVWRTTSKAYIYFTLSLSYSLCLFLSLESVLTKLIYNVIVAFQKDTIQNVKKCLSSQVN